jgi:hypothetical protein
MAQTASEQPKPQRILQKAKSTPVEGYLLGELHSVLDPTNRDNASLLVFQFNLLSLERHRRLTSAAITIRFADAQGRGKFDPEVVSWAPNGVFSVQETVHHEVVQRVGSLGAPIWEDMRDKTMYGHYGARLSAYPRIEGRNYGKRNAVVWSIIEDDVQKRGISYSFEAAVLLKRANNDNFLAEIHLDTQTASGSTILSTIESFFRRDSGVADNLIPLNPGALVRRKVRGDPDRLGQIDLQKLSSIRIPTLNPNKARANIDGDENGLIQVVEGLKKEQKLFDFSRGLHPEVWYKFKRFETLSLLNLYNYQDKLVKLDKQINEAGG